MLRWRLVFDSMGTMCLRSLSRLLVGLCLLSPSWVLGQELPPPPTAPYYGQPTPPPMQALPSGPIVQLRANSPAATLFQLRGDMTMFAIGWRHPVVRRFQTWDPVCRAPCGVAVSPNGVYAIRGWGIVPSDAFMLPQGGVISLAVNVGHRGPHAGGVLLTTFGGLATVVGSVFTPLSYLVGNGVGGSGPSSSGPEPRFLTAGATLLGLGTAMIAGGIAILVISQTRVRASNGEQLARRDRPPRLALSANGLHF